MHQLITALFLFTAAQPVENWQEVTQNDRGTVSVDAASKQRTGDMVTLRTRTVFAEAMADGTNSVVVRMQYDCRRNRSETLAVTMLGAEGNVIMAQDVPADQRQPEPIVADSPDAALAAFACRDNP